MAHQRTLPQYLAFLLYDFLLLLIYIPVTIKWGLWRQFYLSNKRYQRRGQRYGDIAEDLVEADDWFHCVSVGEVVAASCVIKALLQEEPTRKITITTSTPTGAGRVRDIFGETVQHHYLPWDLPWLINALILALNPKRVFITEVELWPNMIMKLAKHQIPIMLINARMTERSAQKYAQFSLLSEPVFAKIQHVCAQGERDFEAYQQLGFGDDRLTLTQNIKFDQVTDIAVSDEVAKVGKSLVKRFVIVAGSTHPGEEEHWLEVLEQCNIDDVLLVLVPRHPERFDKVVSLLRDREIPFQRWSDYSDLADATQVLLVDAMGVLSPLYHCADVAFVGGSIAERGGHNALEPAFFAVPILMGEHRYNNPVICAMLEQAGALYLTTSVEQSVERICQWYDDPQARIHAGQSGEQVLHANRGALSKTLEVIREKAQ
ncbi:MAG: 3-deoxy-D-manno-octulosonic acid transferase [Alteromonadaceae bacterium]|nr:3-deoxy-D-manno-octulosonic acid transferase [Alteromonadaceae bacterium]